MLANSGADTNVMRRGRKGKTRLRTLDQIDGRTRSAKRARELIAMWSEALCGSPSLVTQRAIVHAAACQALCEDLQSRALSGDPSVTIEQVTKASNITDRAIRALNLPEPSLQKRLNGLRPLRWR